MRSFTTRQVVYLSLLTALEIVLNRFLSINAWNIKIGFSFVPVAAAGMLFGMLPAAIVAALGDFLGAILFPIGPYFPGFTFTAFLTGLTFGFFLRRERTIPRILGAVAVNQLILSLLLNSLWISLLYGSPYAALLATRAVQCAILAPVQFAVLLLLRRAAANLERRLTT
mgnify:CR=1 FL=1